MMTARLRWAQSQLPTRVSFDSCIRIDVRFRTAVIVWVKAEIRIRAKRLDLDLGPECDRRKQLRNESGRNRRLACACISHETQASCFTVQPFLDQIELPRSCFTSFGQLLEVSLI